MSGGTVLPKAQGREIGPTEIVPPEAREWGARIQISRRSLSPGGCRDGVSRRTAGHRLRLARFPVDRPMLQGPHVCVRDGKNRRVCCGTRRARRYTADLKPGAASTLLCVCVCVCVCVCASGRVSPLALLMFFLFSRVAVEQLRLLPRLRRRVLANFFWTSTFVSSQFHPHT